MKTKTMTLEEIRTVGLDALAKKLGRVGMVRFLQQFENGRGDYTADRNGLLGHATVKTLTDRCRRHRRTG